MTPRKYDVLALVGAGLLLLTACSGGTKPDPEPTPTSTCGNGKVESGEACDDGNLNDNDGCHNDCTLKVLTCGNGHLDAAEECDDGNTVDTDSCSNSCKLPAAHCGNGTVEAGEACDDGNRTGGDGCEVTCQKSQLDVEDGAGASLPPPAPGSGTCTVTAGTGTSKLFTGYVLLDGRIIKGGQVLVDDKGIIQCAEKDCTAAAGASTATTVVCPEGVISPGLINPHDHITYQQKPGTKDVGTERYEHRHDWRKGNNGHTVQASGDNANTAIIKWAELRQVMAGTTSVAGSGSQNGLLRNVDKTAQEGLGEPADFFDTFPLGDSGGKELTSGCAYGTATTFAGTLATEMPALAAYLPHVGEGIEASAQHEFSCVNGTDSTGQNLFGMRTAVIHGIGVTAREIAKFAETGTGLIWSPRSNISLYGDTAMVPAYKNLGVEIALGTDWLQSGSMNELRELQCADYLNSTRFGNALTDEELWRMVTANAADLTDTHEKIGRIAVGKVADLAIFTLRAFAQNPHRAVITANPQDVVLTLRGGKALYGDAALVQGLSAASEVCDAVDVCGSSKSVCVKSEIGSTLAELTTAAAAAPVGAYPLFSCDPVPANEPTCEPARTATAPVNASVNGSTVYASMASADDADADGIVDAQDNCPGVFNPVRPMDNGSQLDTDGDGKGDVCDPCPLDANSTTCASRNPYDDDGDGVPNGQDNCAFTKNADQADSDGDGLGDACEPVKLAPTSIYDLKAKAADGTYALKGKTVYIEDALVTALNPSQGYFVSAFKDGAYPTGKGVDGSAVYVFDTAATVKVGDRVSFTALVDVYFNLLELKTVKDLSTLSSDNALPPFERVAPSAIRTGGPRAEALIGVLVQLDSSVFVTDAALGNGEFAVDVAKGTPSATAGVRVDDAFFKYTLPSVNAEFTKLQGVLFFSFDNTKLEPRSADDMAMVAVAPAVASLTPATSYLRVGQADKKLTVTLSNSYDKPVTVDVTSSAPADLGVPTTVTVDAGATTADIPLTATNANASVIVSAATSVGSAVTATVEVLAVDAPARLLSLSPSAAVSLTAGSSQDFTVTVDAPVAADTSIPVTVTATTSGKSFGTAPADVVIAAGQSQGTFTFAAAADGDNTGSVSVASGGTTLSTNVTVVPASASPGKLVINEVDYDQDSTDAGEFIELRNIGSSPVSLANLALIFVNGSNAAAPVEYFVLSGGARVDLSTVGTSLAPGEFIVVANTGVFASVPASVTKRITIPGNTVQNGGSATSASADAIGIINVSTGERIDSVVYEGPLTAPVTLTNVPGTVVFQEGAADPAALNDFNTASSIARSAAGTDTDVNATDFKVVAPTPGALNP